MPRSFQSKRSYRLPNFAIALREVLVVACICLMLVYAMKNVYSYKPKPENQKEATSQVIAKPKAIPVKRVQDAGPAIVPPTASPTEARDSLLEATITQIRECTYDIYIANQGETDAPAWITTDRGTRMVLVPAHRSWAETIDQPAAWAQVTVETDLMSIAHKELHMPVQCMNGVNPTRS